MTRGSLHHNAKIEISACFQRLHLIRISIIQQARFRHASSPVSSNNFLWSPAFKPAAAVAKSEEKKPLPSGAALRGRLPLLRRRQPPPHSASANGAVLVIHTPSPHPPPSCGVGYPQLTAPMVRVTIRVTFRRPLRDGSRDRPRGRLPLRGLGAE